MISDDKHKDLSYGEALEDEITNEVEPEECKDELTLLKERLEEETAKAQENHDKYVRALADADNQRKRWQKDKEEILRFGNMPLLRKLLPVIDDFERAKAAIEQGGDIPSVLKGVELMEKRLLSLLEQEGVKVISAKGQKFDPLVHEAMSIDESGKHPDGTIVQEYQTGYMYLERVLRPSMVVVAQAKSATDEQ